MTLSGGRNVANALELAPRICSRVVRPDIVEPRYTIGTAKARTVSLGNAQEFL